MPFVPYRGDHYLDADAIDAWLDQLAQAAPAWVTVEQAGRSRMGRPIRVVTVGARAADAEAPAQRPAFWLDAGTHRSLIEASTYIEAIEERQGLKIGCLQEIAWTKGWISNEEFRREAEAASGSSYGTYLAEVLDRVENKSAGG